MRGIGMSTEEENEFIGTQRQLYLATISPSGWPHVAPVGFARLDDGSVYVLTHPNQRKSQNIFHNNKVAVVFESGETYTTLKGVFMHGYATVVTDQERWPELERAWVDQHYGGTIPDIVKKVYTLRDGWIWFEITPVHTISWDNSNLDPERLQDVPVPAGMPFEYHVPDELGSAAPASSD